MSRPTHAAMFLLALAAPVVAADLPVLRVESVDLAAGRDRTDVRIQITSPTEAPALFVFGVAWDGGKLDLEEVHWRGTIFEPFGQPSATSFELKPNGAPIAGVSTIGFCNPCKPLIPAGETVAVASLRFRRLSGFTGETATAVRLVRSPPFGAQNEGLDPQLYDGGYKPVTTEDGFVRLRQTRSFLRGDRNFDALFDISDAIGTLEFLFIGRPAGECSDSADANDDGQIDIADAIFSLEAQFLGGAPPPAPFPDPGLDPTADRLGCDEARCDASKLVFEQDPSAQWDFVEFCIPDSSDARSAVEILYPEVEFRPGSRGRIGCVQDQVLCTIPWAQVEHFKLCQLARLSFITEIRGSHFE